MRVTFRVHGRVQGVGYRYFARHEALRLGLLGWVRNEFDGSVRGEAEGSEAALEIFRTHLAEGPSLGHVTRLDWWHLDEGQSFPLSFEIH